MQSLQDVAFLRFLLVAAGWVAEAVGTAVFAAGVIVSVALGALADAQFRADERLLFLMRMRSLGTVISDCG